MYIFLFISFLWTIWVFYFGNPDREMNGYDIIRKEYELEMEQELELKEEEEESDLELENLEKIHTKID